VSALLPQQIDDVFHGIIIAGGGSEIVAEAHVDSGDWKGRSALNGFLVNPFQSGDHV